MPKQLLETLNGVGEVYSGEVLLRTTPYRLSVWADDQATAIAGTVRVDGHIDITGIGEAIVLAGPESLTLKLEDGRRLSFSVTDTGGTIVGRGGLE